MEGWPEIGRHCIETVSPWLWIFFVAFILFTNVVLLNLVIGVVLENVLTISEHEEQLIAKKEKVQRDRAVTKLKHAFECADVNGDGSLTIEEFITAMSNEEMLNRLKACAVAKYEALELFTLLDVDERGSIDVE